MGVKKSALYFTLIISYFFWEWAISEKKIQKKKSKKNHHRRSSSDVSKIHIFLPNFAKYPKIFPKEKKKKSSADVTGKKIFFLGGREAGEAGPPGREAWASSEPWFIPYALLQGSTICHFP